MLSLKPETIAHSHFRNAEGEAYIQASVTKMRDAVQYMWDELKKGMNGGKTVWELMRDIQLPPELELSQGHGKVSWSVRAAWEIVAGWYYYDTIAMPEGCLCSNGIPSRGKLKYEERSSGCSKARARGSETTVRLDCWRRTCAHQGIA